MDPTFTFTVDSQEDAEEAFATWQVKRFLLPRDRLERLALLRRPPQSWYEEDDFGLFDNELDDLHALTERWQQETRFSSALNDIESHPSYRAIVACGWPAVPFILDQLRSKPHWWFAALREITGQDPVSPEDRGSLQKMTAAWLRWASPAVTIVA